MRTNGTKRREWVFASCAILVALVLWEAISRCGAINPRLFPPPSAVALALRQWAVSGDLIRDVAGSLWRIVVGLLLGGSIGIGLGLLTGRFRHFRRWLAPVIQVLRPLPPVAIVPLVIVWLGIGDGAKFFSIAFAVFFPVWINVHVGAASIPVNYLRSARLLSKSRMRLLFRVVLPATASFAVAGIRTGIAIAFIMAYVTELAGASSGIGYRISITHLAYRIDGMVAALAVLAALGALTDLAFSRATRRLLPWLRSPEHE